MKAWRAVAVVLACAVLAGFGDMATASTPDRRIALVIGNARYNEAPLRNPVNDARAMAAALRERGFEVLLRENTTKQQMESVVADFGEKLTEGATGLFFYAGHGMQVNGRNYLVPVDAKITAEARVRLEALDVDAVLDQMQAAKSKVNVVILDACRNNPFERRFRSAGGGLAQINAPEGTLIAYATAPGKVAADGEGSNGLYTQELLRALRTPGLKVEDVFKQVRINVSRASQGGQTPWEASSLIGDFYFVAPKPIAATSAQSGDFLERSLWEMVQSSKDPAEIQFFLRQFPNSTLAGQARQRLAALPAAPTTTTPAPSAPLPSSPKPRVAAAVVPPKLVVSGSPFDGRYRASIKGAMLLAHEFPAEIEINGTRVTGSAMRGNAPRPCPISGSIAEDGTVRPGLRIDCDQIADSGYLQFQYPAILITLDGRFTRSEQTGDVVGQTAFRTTQGLTGSITWQRAGDLQASAAASVSAFEGRYAATLRDTHPLTSVYLQASFEMAARQIRGSGYMYPDGRVCPLSGTVEADGTARFTLGCEASEFAASTVKSTHTLMMTGRFIESADGGAVAAMTFRSNEGRTGTVVWQRQN